MNISINYEIHEETSLTLFINYTILYSILELSKVKTNFVHLVIDDDIVHIIKGINQRRLH